ncbi:MAG TPA: hypothetical protein VG435_00220 [Acidimicrobiales bacterium]|jgi:hypothetical protein|nr:hypothetical protein [Acidimicrobiales bacterium]
MGRWGPAAWPANQDLDDTVLLWQAVLRHRLDRRRTLFHPFGRRTRGHSLLGHMGGGTGGRLMTGPSADALSHAQRSALNQLTPGDEAAHERLFALELASQELEKRLSDTERAALRTAGDVPDWLPKALKARADQIRKERLRASWA